MPGRATGKRHQSSAAGPGGYGLTEAGEPGPGPTRRERGSALGEPPASHVDALLRGRLLWGLLAAILLLALALRGFYFLRHLYDFRLVGDALNYQIMSWQWVEDGIYGYGLRRPSGTPNAYVTPAYPLFLSAIYALVRDPYLQISVARAAQVLIGTVSVGLGFLAVRRMLRRTDVALLTALLMAVYPPYIQSPVQILTEVLSLATMLLYFWLQAAGLQEGRRSLNLAAGLAFASQILVRPVLLPLTPLPFAYVLWKRGWGRWREVVAAGVWTAAGTLLLLLPWGVRNLLVLDRFVLTSTGSANPFLAGTYPYLRGLFDDFYAAGLKSEDQAWFARKRLREGFRTEPLHYLRWYTLGKIRMTFETPWLYESFSHRPRLMTFMRWGHQAVSWAGLAGLLLGALRERVMRFTLVYLALFLGLYLLFIPTTRYAYQLMFFLLVGASYLASDGAQLVLQRVGARSFAPQVTDDN